MKFILTSLSINLTLCLLIFLAASPIIFTIVTIFCTGIVISGASDLIATKLLGAEDASN